MNKKALSLQAALITLIGVAASTGLLVSDAAARVASPRREDDDLPPLLLAPQLDVGDLLAHRSHSSHRSHRSHSSHSSGSSGWHYSGSSGRKSSGGWGGSSGGGSSGGGSSGGGSSGGGSSGGGSSGGGSSGGSWDEPSSVPAPRPKPAKVELIASPGGTIVVDGVEHGSDATGVLELAAGTHVVEIRNRFLGVHTTTVSVTEGQRGKVKLEW